MVFSSLLSSFYLSFSSSFLSFSLSFVSINIVTQLILNLHIAQGQKQYLVEIWGEEKGRETILFPPSIK
jgi:hypothetical protein